MSSEVRYRETLRMQPSTFRKLVGVLSLSFVPLAAFVWSRWRPLGGVVVIGLLIAFSAVFRATRWQLEVRTGGLYYRVVPFFPVWRSVAEASTIRTVSVDHDVNGKDVLEAEGALFPWSSGNRTIVMNVDGGVRIERASGTDVFVSSRSPDAFASALNAVVR